MLLRLVAKLLGLNIQGLVLTIATDHLLRPHCPLPLELLIELINRDRLELSRVLMSPLVDLFLVQMLFSDLLFDLVEIPLNRCRFPLHPNLYLSNLFVLLVP